jgi:hypothetical protein
LYPSSYFTASVCIRTRARPKNYAATKVDAESYGARTTRLDAPIRLPPFFCFLFPACILAWDRTPDRIILVLTSTWLSRAWDKTFSHMHGVSSGKIHSQRSTAYTVRIGQLTSRQSSSCVSSISSPRGLDGYSSQTQLSNHPFRKMTMTDPDVSTSRLVLRYLRSHKARDRKQGRQYPGVLFQDSMTWRKLRGYVMLIRDAKVTSHSSMASETYTL